jgi:hypothetical protein
LLLYADNIILMASSPDLLHRMTGRLSLEFVMTDLGVLHHFLDIFVTHSSDRLFLS